jgi:serine/threonine protein kinase
MFGQMLSGLGRLHDLGILHRDVKVNRNLYIEC